MLGLWQLLFLHDTRLRANIKCVCLAITLFGLVPLPLSLCPCPKTAYFWFS